jgi:DNA-binding winged helix-turn-helix (wHTH) protein
MPSVRREIKVRSQGKKMISCDQNWVFSFGEFSVDTRERVLSREGQPIPLTARVFDTLVAFLSRPGITLTKDELLTTIWQNKFVEESNIVQNVAILRKALNDTANESRYLATVPGYGYRFIARVRCNVSLDGMASQMTESQRITPDSQEPSRRLAQFAAITGLAARSVRRSSRILFCGFYDTSKAGGHLARTPLSRRLEREFLSAFGNGFHNHGIQNYHSIRVLNFRPPALIHGWCDHHRFDRLLSLYRDKSLAVVWGTTDGKGIKTLEVKLNRALSLKNPQAEDHLKRLVRIMNRFKLLPEERVRYLGTFWAAIWCQSFCNDIAYGGNWLAAQDLATESRGIIERALEEATPKQKQKRALSLLTKCYCQSHAFR